MPSNEPTDLGIDGYEDAVEIGRGGFAVVYRARRVAFNQIVAVKVLPYSTRSSESWKRYERELQVMGALAGHPNIVTVYEAGVTNRGDPFFSMEYLPNGTLAEQLDRAGPIGVGPALHMGIKLAGALAQAHRASVLHRDIKPENILMSKYGEPKLGDFGVSHMEGVFQTQSGVITASVAHASPEALSGKRAAVTGDIYSLASTLYAAVHGTAPFVRDTDETLVPLLARIGSEPVPDLRRYGVPNSFCEIIERSMEKDPADRYQTADELLQDFLDCQREITSQSAPASLNPNATYRGRSIDFEPDEEDFSDDPSPTKPRRNRKLLLATAAIVVTALVGGGAYAAMDQPDDSVRAVSDGTVAVAREPRAVATGAGDLWVASFGAKKVTRIDPATNSIEANIDVEEGPMSVVADDQAVWVGHFDGSIVRIDTATNTPTLLRPKPASEGTPIHSYLALSPDGLWAITGPSTIERFDIHSNQSVETIGVEPGVSSLLPQGDSLWYTYQDEESGFVSQYDTNNREKLMTLRVGDGPNHLITAGGYIWLSNFYSDTVSRVNSRAASVTTIEVPARPGAIALRGDELWVTSTADGTVSRIDIEQASVVNTLKAGNSADGVVSLGDSLWVANHDESRVSRVNL